jgi:hypothetical protein
MVPAPNFPDTNKAAKDHPKTSNNMSTIQISTKASEQLTHQKWKG